MIQESGIQNLSLSRNHNVDVETLRFIFHIKSIAEESEVEREVVVICYRTVQNCGNFSLFSLRDLMNQENEKLSMSRKHKTQSGCGEAALYFQ